MSLSERVEKHLAVVLGPPGRVTRARDPESGTAAAFRVITFPDQPVEGAFTLVTVGLSDRPLRGPSGEAVRQELLVCAWDSFYGDALYQVLFSMAHLIREGGETADPGTVLELPQPIATAVPWRHLFLFVPGYHPEKLQPISLGENEVEICWLIPVTPEESALIEKEGPEAFDDLLDRADPDLMDFGRGSVV